MYKDKSPNHRLLPLHVCAYRLWESDPWIEKPVAYFSLESLLPLVMKTGTVDEPHD
jgi:hypothetical protein